MWDWFTSADTFSSTRVFVPVFLTVEDRVQDTTIYGSGTKLFVTAETFVTSLKDEQVVKPVVSVYPAASRAHWRGGAPCCVWPQPCFLLVQFSWKRQKEGGPLEELPLLRESSWSSQSRDAPPPSCWLIGAPYTYKYHCYVKPEGGTVKAQTAQVIQLHVETLSQRAEQHSTDWFLLTPSLLQWFPGSSPASVQGEAALSALPVLMIVKSLLYCCGLPLLMSLRNKGLSTSCTQAD
ncbi:hypothetical protein INR49_016386 [Caranx melampygus]|nr:hypothetical protein INR49_016386 [Caranx melampygus]